MSEQSAAGGNSEIASEPGNPITDRIAGMAHDGIDQAAKTASQAERGVRHATARTAEAAQHTRDGAATAADESLRKLRLYVEENPLTTAAIAFAAGIFVSALVRRS